MAGTRFLLSLKVSFKDYAGGYFKHSRKPKMYYQFHAVLVLPKNLSSVEGPLSLSFSEWSLSSLAHSSSKLRSWLFGTRDCSLEIGVCCKYLYCHLRESLNES